MGDDITVVITPPLSPEEIGSGNVLPDTGKYHFHTQRITFMLQKPYRIL
jgi:hypothetical protein